MLPPILPSFSTREYLRTFQPYFCRTKKGASTESSQIIGMFVTFVYTNPSLFITEKMVHSPKELGYVPYFFELKTNSRYKWKIKKGAGSH